MSSFAPRSDKTEYVLDLCLACVHVGIEEVPQHQASQERPSRTGEFQNRFGLRFAGRDGSAGAEEEMCEKGEDHVGVN
ncbi:hypothetical protein N7470_001508 [Penicillium chermesinum]|nr:hypothetical protein N7470_001508 [Penicillium chermesinum]